MELGLLLNINRTQHRRHDMKKRYYICLGCFNIQYDKTVCCEKHPGEPYALDIISRDDAIEHCRLMKKYNR